jgi:hypothetical protein
MIRRRDFIAAAGASGVLAAVTQPLAAAVGPDANAPIPALDADFDFSWIDKLTGKHKAVFESLDVAEGAAFFRANMWRNQYKQVYNTDPKDMNAVVVVRHHGFALAMSDAYWQKYEVAKEFEIKDDSGNLLKSNPVGETAKGANTIAAFVESGGIVLGCNVAFGAVVGTLRKKENLSREEADKLARTYLLPGVILQPSGVFAVLRAQEAGCNYILAS